MNVPATAPRLPKNPCEPELEGVPVVASDGANMVDTPFWLVVSVGEELKGDGSGGVEEEVVEEVVVSGVGTGNG